MFGIDPLTTGALMVLAASGNVCDMAGNAGCKFCHGYDPGRDAKTGHGYH